MPDEINRIVSSFLEFKMAGKLKMLILILALGSAQNVFSQVDKSQADRAKGRMDGVNSKMSEVCNPGGHTGNQNADSSVTTTGVNCVNGVRPEYLEAQQQEKDENDGATPGAQDDTKVADAQPTDQRETPNDGATPVAQDDTKGADGEGSDQEVRAGDTALSENDKKELEAVRGPRGDCINHDNPAELLADSSLNPFRDEAYSETKAAKHLRVANACAEAIALKEAGGQTECRSEAGVEDESKNLPSGLEPQVYRGHLCDHYVKITEVGIPQFAKVAEKMQKAYDWVQGDAEANIAGVYSELVKRTGRFLEDNRIYPGQLERCEDELGKEFTPGSEGFKLYEALRGTSMAFSPASVTHFNSCIEPLYDVPPYGEDHELFTREDKASFGRRDQTNWSFFTNFKGQGIGNINAKRLCKDHARNFCFPALSYYYRCEESGDGPAKTACLKDAKDAVSACLVGKYDKTVPDRILEEDAVAAEFFTKKDGSDVALKNDKIIWVPISKINEQILGEAASIAQPENEKEYFALQFHEMYGSCVILRNAAKAMADSYGETKIIHEERIVSVKNNYDCFRALPWTVDFNQCATQIQYGDGMFDILAEGANTGLAIKESYNQSNINEDLGKDIAAGDQTAYIKAQEAKLRREAENSYGRSGIAGTHAITLVAMASSYPTPNALSTACSQPIDSHYGDEVLNCGMAWVLGNHDSVRLDNESRVGLENPTFANQEIRDQFYMKAADKMTDSIFQGLLGYQRSKQAGDLEGVQRQYNDFFNQDAVTPEYVGVSYCEQNPSAPSCQSSERVRQSNLGSAFGNVGMQNQGGGNFNFNKSVPDGFESEEEISAAEREARERLGDVIGNGGGKSFDNDYSAPGAAKAKMGRSGGGGGGGGAGGGGAGGGSTAPAPKKSDGKGPQQGVTKSGSKMIAGTGGVNYRPGSSANRNKKKSNAFQDLFGSKKSRGVATTVEDIAPAKSQLFDKISKRYGKVSADKRLYEFGGE